MNDRLLEILAARPDFSISPEDKKLLDIFSEYLDRGSLFLSSFVPSDNPAFIFTNDAQHYTFTMSDIRSHVNGLKQGKAMDWESLPYEYAKKM